MKTLKYILIAAAVVAATACSTLRTAADYDRSADFAKYHTFAIKDVQSKNQLMERRIEGALETQLTAKGLAKSDTDPDLWVVPHFRLSHETEISTWDTGWGYGWRWRRPLGPTVSTVERIPVGTLIVDLVDAKTNEMVWRGTATDTLHPSASPPAKEKHLTAAVAKMLQAYPPAV